MLEPASDLSHEPPATTAPARPGPIWAPWRIEYIRSDKSDSGCVLCGAAGAADDRDGLVLFRGKSCYALLNRYPYNSGHLMVTPYRHVAELGSLGQEELTELMLMTERCVTMLRRLMRPEGFNIGLNLGRAAGAGIEDHLHIHVVPRWVGDTNYMPVLADVRVVPQALLETWAELRREAERPQAAP